jgi:hypothetical protein
MSEKAEPSILDRETRILVPVELPGEVQLHPVLVQMLGEARVVVLGCYVVPEQTSPEHARSQFEEGSQTTIGRVVDNLEDENIEVESELVFTPDPVQTIDRVSKNLRIDAVLWPSAVESVDRVLALVSPGVDYERVVKCLASTTAIGEPSLSLLQFAENEADEAERDLALDGLVARLTEAGIPEVRLEAHSEISSARLDDLEELAADYDVLVLAYTAEMANRRFIDEVRGRVDMPVLIVRAEDG